MYATHQHVFHILVTLVQLLWAR